MKDQYNREIDYLRISLTSQCNLRCLYCAPEGSCQKVEDTLSTEDVLQLIRASTRLGIKKVKLTGGEPLMRKDIVEIVKAIKTMVGIEEVTLTTNGVLLDKYIDELARSGLDGLNISLDTLDAKTYYTLTKRDMWERVMRGIKRAIQLGIPQIKINVVPLQGINEAELVGLALLAKENRIHIRFIELMPIGYGKQFQGIPKEQIQASIEKVYGKLIPYNKVLGNGPATYYSVDTFKGKIGFISALSHTFCKACNRIRITSEGYLKLCLHYNAGINLMPYIKEEEVLYQVLAREIYTKPSKHHFHEQEMDKSMEYRNMIEIGG